MLETQNIEAEMSVLGAVLLDCESFDEAAVVLTSADFGQQTYKEVFMAMEQLSENSRPIDMVSLTAEIKANGKWEAIGGFSTLNELVDLVPTAANIGYYVKLVKDCSLYRRAKVAASEALNAKEGEDINKYLDRCESQFLSVRDSVRATDIPSVKQIVRDCLKDLENRYENGEVLTGLETGITELDELLCGLNDGDLVIIAGRPGMGKSALVGNIADKVGHEKNPRVGGGGILAFSLEMPKKQWVNRILVSNSGVHNSRFRTGRLEDSDWAKIGDATQGIAEMKYFVDDTPGIGISELRAKARRIHRKNPLSLIIVDYIQQMSVTGESRQEGVGEISRQLKILAKELGIPVLALSQLNRKVEERSEKRPIMSDLRESGNIEQDADIIIFAHREAGYCQDCKNGTCTLGHERDAELIVAKQRNGAVGTVKAVFRGEHFRYDNPPNRDNF